MQASQWIAEHWFDLLQTIGIVGGLLFTAYTTRKDEKARKVGNLIAVNHQYQQIWRELFERPELARVLEDEADINRAPITDAERVFVRLLITHLSTVYRAMKEGMFVPLEGLRRDTKEFFSLPIPKFLWQRLSRFQDKDFVHFVENCLR